MTITFIIHMFLSELKDILTCLEDDGIRAMFTDSKAQYHHSIRKVKHVQATLLLHPSQWGQSLCGYLRAQISLHTFHQIIGFSGEIIAQQELFCMVMLLVNYHCQCQLAYSQKRRRVFLVISSLFNKGKRQVQIHMGFHRFTEIGHIFHNKYVFNIK